MLITPKKSNNEDTPELPLVGYIYKYDQIPALRHHWLLKRCKAASNKTRAFKEMKKHVFSIATIFAMSLQTVISGVLPACHVLAARRSQIMEIREIFLTIRSSIQKQDDEVDLRILQTSLIHNIPSSDRCCFLEHIINFYMDKVFRHYDLLAAEHKTSIGKIANSFCEIFRGPKSCFDFSSTCEDITMLNLKAIENSFKKLSQSKAVIKAIGELDILLNWMNRLH